VKDIRFTEERANTKIRFRLSEENILYTDCFPNTEMTLEDGIESTRISAEMVKNTPRPLLCDLTNVVKMSKECRSHFAGPEHTQTFTKCALIVTSPVSTIIGNFFLGLNKPLKPTRLFTNREEGLKWLREK
jgi:hypothetical protein